MPVRYGKNRQRQKGTGSDSNSTQKGKKGQAMIQILHDLGFAVAACFQTGRSAERRRYSRKSARRRSSERNGVLVGP